MVRKLFTFGVALCLVSVSLSAQTIADIAKQQREKKKEKGQTKVFTEQDLKTNGGKMTESKKSSAEEQKSGPSGSAESAATKSSDLKGKDESYWRNRKNKIKEELTELEKKFKEADDWLRANHTRYTLQSLTPYKNDRDALQRSIDEKKKELNDLEDEARRAGAPPGWLREK